MADHELEKFKSSINFVEYTSLLNYEIDKKESSKSSIVMRNHATSNKIIITRGIDNHWIYFSVHDDNDNGSIIDFVQTHKNLSLGQVRQELRPWAGDNPPASTIKFSKDSIKPANKDRQQVIHSYSKTENLEYSKYLETSRGISASIQKDPRFLGKIRIDKNQFNNIIFPHCDRFGISGFEIKNKGFTGFAKGGEKGLWFSNFKETDTRLVFTETAIDALSYHTLKPDPSTRYISVGGSLNPTQPDLIKGAILKMPVGSEIIIATDADAGGRKIAALIAEYADNTSRTDLEIIRAEPPEEGQDWNNQLCDKLGIEYADNAKNTPEKLGVQKLTM